MRTKIIIITGSSILISVFFWRIRLTPEYLCFVGDSRVKCRVIEYLDRKAEWRARRLLAGLLQDENPNVRRTAVACAGAMDLKVLLSSVEQLAWEDEDVLARAQAIEVLAMLDSRKASSVVLAGLSDPEPDIRVGSLLAVSRGVDVSSSVLLFMLKDSDSRVRDAALNAVVDRRIVGAVPILAEDFDTQELFDLGQTLEALQRITGVNKGISKDEWLTWHRENGAVQTDR